MTKEELTAELTGTANIDELLPYIEITMAALREMSEGTDYQVWENMSLEDRQHNVAITREICSQLQTIRVIADHGPFCAQSVVLLKAVENMEDLNDKQSPY